MRSIAFKTLAAAALLLSVFIGCGLTGVMFQIWPTFANDHALDVTPQMLQQLTALKSERKFDRDDAVFYPGAPSEAARVQAQTAVDATIERLIQELPRSPRRATVLAAFKSALAQLASPDTEERDQTLIYFQRIMRIVGVRDAGELFNVWRYGVPYGWLISATPEARE